MKRFLSFVIIIGLLVTGLFLFTPKNESSPSLVAQTPLSPSSIPSQPVRQVGIPKKLVIEKLSIDADIESVGLDSEKRMDVPKKSENVGWYMLGFKPGEKGSAVIDGHFDKATGAPAVFYNLSQLAPHDLVKIVDAQNRTYTFQVTRSEMYDFDKLPLKEIFDSRDRGRLNLITCDGVFDQTSKNYSK